MDANVRQALSNLDGWVWARVKGQVRIVEEFPLAHGHSEIGVRR